MLESYPYNQDPLATLVAKFRQERSADTMLDRVQERLRDGRWHFRFQQVATDSGRLSTTPNSQNITAELRDIFEASPGNVMEVGDFSQIELRVLNYLARDPYMDEVFNNYDTGKGVNIHRATQGGLVSQGITHITYGLAKNINFTVIYLGDEHTLEQRYGVPLEVGVKFIQGYFATYPGVKRWLDNTIVDIQKKGYAETLYGRKREFPDLQNPKSPPWARDKAIREGVNHIIQGSAGEINKECLILMAGEPTINNVHDEILADITPGYTVQWPGPEDLAPFSTPIESGQGLNWREAKP
jgi:DNA polymerase-1